jgi:hypothetical protein
MAMRSGTIPSTVEAVAERSDTLFPCARTRPAGQGCHGRFFKMRLLRLFADDEGESHSEDVEIPFEEVDDYIDNTPPVWFSSFEAASEYGFERVPPGWVGSWHPAPQRVLAIYLSGQLEIEASDGEVRPIGPGTILLAEDTTGKGHRNRVSSPTELEMVFITLPDKAPDDPT